MVLYKYQMSSLSVTFIQCHSFGLPDTYLNICFSEITGLFDGVFIRTFIGHLTKMDGNPIYGKTKHVLL